MGRGSIMEALWDLEDKWKVSTQGAALLLACTATLLVVGLCAATILKKRARAARVMSSREEMSEDGTWRGDEPAAGWGSVKKVLMGSVRWSGASKWKKEGAGRRRRREGMLLVPGKYEVGVGWQSHSSDSPVWQRPILMGEKCELPRFSGLILYDERGRPLHHHSDAAAPTHPVPNHHHLLGLEEYMDATVKATLRDFL